MTDTVELRRQHDAVSQVMTGISRQILTYRARDDAYLLTHGVAQLLGLLRTHLAEEDMYLYPQLINSGHRQTAMMAQRFADEMGDLAERFEDFAMRWSSSAGITARFDEFRSEANAIFAALETRIRRENRQLYPLADRLAPSTRAAA